MKERKKIVAREKCENNLQIINNNFEKFGKNIDVDCNVLFHFF